FLFFRHLLIRDKEGKYGRSILVWTILLGVIIFTSTVWLRQNMQSAAEKLDFGASFQKLDVIFGRSIFTQVGLIVLALAILFDINYRIQKRERQTEVEKALAEDASRAKTSFLSNMSHEIRSPMNSIIGLTRIALRDPDLKPETRRQLEKISASAKHLLELINEILDMSRIESGRMILRSEEFSFPEILDQVGIMIGGQCDDKGLTYRCTLVGQVPERCVGDGMKLKQVLINILGNSVKFTEAPGTVSLTAEALEAEEGRALVRFTMQDTGAGMDASFLPRIFEPFSQENGTSTNRYGGTGLGMAITKSFVDMMEGQILVESTKGVGSTFTVTLPLRVSEHTAASAPEEQTQPAVSLAGRRVLLAEDVPENAEILEDLLDLEEILHDYAENGAVAVQRIAESPAGYYDAVLMDMRMPVMGGVAATRAIRALPHPDATLPIIAMTANVFEEDIEETRQAGMDAHLTKPIDPDKMYKTLAKLIETRQKT
ncbi:MAG: ATP-binding protein, partial [bacterium]